MNNSLVLCLQCFFLEMSLPLSFSRYLRVPIVCRSVIPSHLLGGIRIWRKAFLACLLISRWRGGRFSMISILLVGVVVYTFGIAIIMAFLFSFLSSFCRVEFSSFCTHAQGGVGESWENDPLVCPFSHSRGGSLHLADEVVKLRNLLLGSHDFTHDMRLPGQFVIPGLMCVYLRGIPPMLSWKGGFTRCLLVQSITSVLAVFFLLEIARVL